MKRLVGARIWKPWMLGLGIWATGKQTRAWTGEGQDLSQLIPRITLWWQVEGRQESREETRCWTRDRQGYKAELDTAPSSRSSGLTGEIRHTQVNILRGGTWKKRHLPSGGCREIRCLFPHLQNGFTVIYLPLLIVWGLNHVRKVVFSTCPEYRQSPMQSYSSTHSGPGRPPGRRS